MPTPATTTITTTTTPRRSTTKLAQSCRRAAARFALAPTCCPICARPYALDDEAVCGDCARGWASRNALAPSEY